MFRHVLLKKLRLSSASQYLCYKRTFNASAKEESNDVHRSDSTKQVETAMFSFWYIRKRVNLTGSRKGRREAIEKNKRKARGSDQQSNKAMPAMVQVKIC